MNASEPTPAARLQHFFSRPSYLVKVICQMIIGIGIAIALIAKVYMIVLTDYQCMADTQTLGNKIRCGNTLAILASGLALSAGFELAYRLFSEGIQSAIDPLIISVCSAILLLISALGIENASWEVAIMLTSLTLTVAALLFCRERFTGAQHGSESSSGGNLPGNTQQSENQ
ncbi:MAG: hypothetical protein AAF404_07515 [Pseudomonadota bacterium]